MGETRKKETNLFKALAYSIEKKIVRGSDENPESPKRSGGRGRKRRHGRNDSEVASKDDDTPDHDSRPGTPEQSPPPQTLTREGFDRRPVYVDTEIPNPQFERPGVESDGRSRRTSHSRTERPGGGPPQIPAFPSNANTSDETFLPIAREFEGGPKFYAPPPPREPRSYADRTLNSNNIPPRKTSENYKAWKPAPPPMGAYATSQVQGSVNGPGTTPQYYGHSSVIRRDLPPPIADDRSLPYANMGGNTRIAVPPTSTSSAVSSLSIPRDSSGGGQAFPDTRFERSIDTSFPLESPVSRMGTSPAPGGPSNGEAYELPDSSPAPLKGAQDREHQKVKPLESPKSTSPLPSEPLAPQESPSAPPSDSSENDANASKTTPSQDMVAAVDAAMTLARITSCIQELRGMDARDPENAVIDMIHQNRSLSQELEEIRKALEQSELVGGELINTKAELKTCRESLASYEARLERLTAEAEMFKDREAQLKTEKERMEHDHRATIDSMASSHAGEIERWKGQVSKLEYEKDNIKRTLQTQMSEQRMAQQEKYMAKLDKALEDSAKERAGLQAQHKETMDILRRGFEEERARSKQQLVAAKQDYETRLRTEQANYAREIDELNKDYNKLERSVEAKKARLQNEFTGKEEQLRKEKEELKALAERERAELESDFRAKEDDWRRNVQQWKRWAEDQKAQYETESQAKEEDWNLRFDQWKRSAESDKLRLQSELQGIIDQKDQQVQDMTLWIEGEKSRLEKEYQDKESARQRLFQDKEATLRKETEDEKEQLRKDFVTKTVALRKENTDLKGELVAREHIKSMTDRELASNFERLAGQVDHLSRIPWDTRMEANWPFSERILQQLHGNTRKLKQQIVQNSLWLIFYERIFATPFTVMGDEGKALQQDWTEQFGTNQFAIIARDWPQPSTESEKYRLEAIKSCLNAIEQREETDETRWRKDAYKQYLTGIEGEVSSTLAKVTSLEEKDVRLLNNTVELAAKLWLQTCSQRYRILVIIPTGTGDALTMRSTASRSLRLVTRPELRRFGNSQGRELATNEIVGGWKGATAEYGPA